MAKGSFEPFLFTLLIFCYNIYNYYMISKYTKQKVTKAIIPVAGFGTRFLPATKAQPKEMLPLVDKPVVQYLVEEAVKSGISDILFITNSSKHSVSDHFSRDLNLEKFLRDRKKYSSLPAINLLHRMARYMHVHQDEPLGSGDAVARARAFVGNDPFAVFYADDVMVSRGTPAIGQLINAYNRYGASVMGLINVQRKEVSKYGVVKSKKIAPYTHIIEDVVEKPNPRNAPSTLVSVGRFVLTPDIFEHIKNVKKKNGEIYLADALAALAKKGSMYGVELEGTWHDCGSKFGFWRANLELGLKHPEIGKKARAHLESFRKK